LEHTEKYLKLSKAKWEKLEYLVYVYFDEENRKKKEVTHTIKKEKKERDECEKEGENEEIEIKEKKYDIILTKEKRENTLSEEEFTKSRLKNNIPLQTVDYDKEMVLNVDPSLASLKKGCYPGQEIVARTMNYAKPPKKLIAKNNNFVFVKN